MKKTIRRGRSNAVIDRNINAFMKLGYSYPAAVRAAKALTGPNAVAENPLSVTWVWGLGAAVALGVGYLFFAKPAAAASTPAPSGSVPITTNASGFPVIVLTPGNMGGLTTMSTATDSGGQQINLQAPPGGAILNVVSSNTNVLFGMSGSPTTSGLALGTPNLPGTTTITVSWTLGGAPQTSTFTITAS